MAHRYSGDPYRVANSAEAAKLLSYTAQLPKLEFDGALLRFADEFGGNLYWTYYMVYETPQTKAWTLRRVVGMSGDGGDNDVTPETIRNMSNEDIRKAVHALQSRYRTEAPLMQTRKEHAAAKQRGESRKFTARGTVRIK